MSKGKIILAGGSGFVGMYLNEKFTKTGYQVVNISRGKNGVNWNDEKGIKEALENAHLVINLAGKSVNCRYNAKNKTEILSSRVDTTKAIGNAILNCNTAPEIWFNASTATIYRHAEDKPMTESEGEIGTGFSVEVAKSWEKAFFDFKLQNTRQVALRMAIVLGQNGGVIKPFKNLVRFGLGGNQGNGNQMFSWIHIEDLYRIIVFLIENKHIQGAVNCSSPFPVTNKALMMSFREVMKMSFGLPAPDFLLEIGARIIKTETELILKSRWVIPEKLLEYGFNFSFPKIQDALKSILNHS